MIRSGDSATPAARAKDGPRWSRADGAPPSYLPGRLADMAAERGIMETRPTRSADVRAAPQLASDERAPCHQRRTAGSRRTLVPADRPRDRPWRAALHQQPAACRRPAEPGCRTAAHSHGGRRRRPRAARRRPSRPVYRLTGAGRALAPVLTALSDWGCVRCRETPAPVAAGDGMRSRSVSGYGRAQ